MTSDDDENCEACDAQREEIEALKTMISKILNARDCIHLLAWALPLDKNKFSETFQEELNQMADKLYILKGENK